MQCQRLSCGNYLLYLSCGSDSISIRVSGKLFEISIAEITVSVPSQVSFIDRSICAVIKLIYPLKLFWVFVAGPRGSVE